MVIKKFSSINSIDPGLWNSFLKPGDILASHDFIQVCEGIHKTNGCFRHVMVLDDDVFVGVASFFLLYLPLDLLSTGLTRYMTSMIRTIYPNLLRVPVVFCGPPVSFGSSCLRVKDGSDVSGTMALIIDALEEFAEEKDVGFICIKELDEEAQARLGPCLRKAGFISAKSLPGCRVYLPWNSFEEYYNCLRAGYRRQVALDLRAAEQSGLFFQTGRGLMTDINTTYQLYSNVIERAQFKMEVLPREFFDILNSCLGKELHGVTISYDSTVVANAVILGRSPVCFFILAGLDYTKIKTGHVYQNLVLRVIKSAIDVGASVLELGQTSYELKCRLGALQTPRYIWIKHRSRAKQKILSMAVPYLFPVTSTTVRRVFRDKIKE